MPPEEFATNQGTVGTTPQALGHSRRAVKYVEVRALSTNAGKIYVGPSTVSASTGYELSAGESVKINIDDPAKVWVVASQASQGYSYLSV